MLCIPSSTRRLESSDVFSMDSYNTDKESQNTNKQYDCVEALQYDGGNKKNAAALESDANQNLLVTVSATLDGMAGQLFKDHDAAPNGNNNNNNNNNNYHEHSDSHGNTNINNVNNDENSNINKNNDNNTNNTSLTLIDDMIGPPLQTDSNVGQDYPDDDLVQKGSSSHLIPTEDFFGNDDDAYSNHDNQNDILHSRADGNLSPMTMSAVDSAISGYTETTHSDSTAGNNHSAANDDRGSSSEHGNGAYHSSIYFLVVAFALILLEIGCLRYAELRIRRSREREREREREEPDPFLCSVSLWSSPSMELDVGLAKAEANAVLEYDNDTDDDDSRSGDDDVLSK